jgi:hypothetical protein
MTAVAPMRKRGRFVLWLGIASGLLLLAGANWHLVHVATTSQPDCVAHSRLGSGDGERGVFSAAQSSCSPRTAQ